ncbi:Predicted double-stranded RNA/RNA-DNA hybrid binding protein (fragment) [Micrococcus luteus]
MGARINHPRTVVDRTLHHDVEPAHPAALVDVGWDFRGPGAKAEEQHRPLRVVRARRPRGTPRDRNGVDLTRTGPVVGCRSRRRGPPPPRSRPPPVPVAARPVPAPARSCAWD